MSEKWKTYPIVAFDTETTGLNPFGGDRIIEFAALVFWVNDEGHVTSKTEYQSLINPGVEIPRIVTQLTGIRNEDVATAQPFEDFAPTVAEILQNAIAVAHNYPFDEAFLRAEFGRAGMPRPIPLAEVDTLDVSRRCFPDARSHKLAEMCKRVDISLEGAHRAINDASATGQAFIELLRRNRVSDGLEPMLDWASALGRAPVGGPFTLDSRGCAFFSSGPHEGKRVEDHPLALAGITKARVRSEGRWHWRYPESSRLWAQKWLDIRGAGRAKQNPKGFRSADWVIAPCIERVRSALGGLSDPSSPGETDVNGKHAASDGSGPGDSPFLSQR